MTTRAAPLPPPPQPAPAPTLQYETALPDTGPRPKWVYVIVGLYGLLFAGVAVVPVLLPLVAGEDFSVGLFGAVGALLLCELALIFLPVRAAKRRPVTRVALWVPVLASGLLAAVLAAGAMLSLAELWRVSDDAAWAVLAAAGALWLMWAAVFFLVSFRSGAGRVAAVLHRWLLAGSVLELLVAVPTHVVTRQRSECCAGLVSGMGICAGVVVMFLAFGPSVVFLYYRRWQSTRRP